MLTRTLHLVRATAAALALLAALPGPAHADWFGSGDVERPLPSLDGATTWINSPPLDAKALRGKVVLVDFWTYSCINCLRTLPYVKAWAQKYGPQGLVVIGVHTPEFDFERSTDNVQRAVRDLQISYPVAVDSRQVLWNAFGTRAWPSLYFVDAKGQIRSRQLGEGRYDQAERMIQQLLREAGQSKVPNDLVSPQALGTQAPAGRFEPVSNETYLGWEQAQGFTSPSGGLGTGGPRSYVPARKLDLNQWTLSGRWSVEAQQITSAQAGSTIAYRFRARDLHLVLGPGRDGRPVRFKIRVDGQPPGADHGSDVAADGSGTVDAYRLYQLVRQSSGEARERLFEIELLDEGVRANAFTFG
ncbi:thioredoxin family protein [Burkholderiaceae bacterium UC74_6]